MDKIEKQRYELIKAMHLIVSSLNDEDAYFSWINTMPDGATDDDFVDIAESNEQYDDICAAFMRIVKGYGNSGLYVWDDICPFGMRETYKVNGEDVTRRFIHKDVVEQMNCTFLRTTDDGKADLMENWYGLQFFTQQK
jgi:hypothetical protein